MLPDLFQSFDTQIKRCVWLDIDVNGEKDKKLAFFEQKAAF